MKGGEPMPIIRPDLQTFARACERLLSVGLGPELSQDEKQFVLYYAAELVKQFGHAPNGHENDVQLLLPIVPASPSEQSASPISPQTQ
jgi:hypothetical protein